MTLKTEKSIKLIAAISDNDVIGLENGELPWILPDDLKHFKKITTGNTIIMGYNTWKSIGEKELPDRMNLVLSRKKRPLPRKRNVKQIHNPMQVRSLPKGWQEGDIFIIGGGKVYNTFLPLVDEMYLTFVHVNIPNEDKCIKFPKIDWTEWTEVETPEEMKYKNIHYEFKHYVRTKI